MPRSILASTALAACLTAGTANAEPVRYTIDPSHTYPSFEADHMGMSLWRGKFNRNRGQVLLDRANNTGSVEVEIDIASVDFGHDDMNAHAVKPDLLDATQFPTATYRGTLADFRDGKPTRVDGELSLHGVTRPLALEIVRFNCKPHPLHQREFCGADARASFQRDDFGIDAGKDWDFDMRVDLRIQVEAIADAPSAEPK